MNIDQRNTRWTRIVIWGLGMMLLALAFSAQQGCVGAPRSLEQVEAMDQAQWEAYLRRVSAWSEVAGYTIVHERPEDFQRVVEFTTILVSLTGDLGSDPIAASAEKVQWGSPLSKLVLIEIQGLLEARGGIPGGERGLELLLTIASGVQDGAMDAATEPQ